ncbi:hypothetical protein J3E69DRAFT_345371 [Trichoderma sp. SZMC 28015]
MLVSSFCWGFAYAGAVSLNNAHHDTHEAVNSKSCKIQSLHHSKISFAVFTNDIIARVGKHTTLRGTVAVNAQPPILLTAQPNRNHNLQLTICQAQKN